jgi:hypothetical protein
VDGDGRHGRLYRLLLVLTPFPRAAGFFFCGFRFLASSSSDSEAELSSELEADDESSSEPDSDSESDSDPESELGESAARFLEFLFGAGFLGDAAGGFFEDAEDDFLLVGFGFNFGVAVFFAGPLRDAAAAGFFFALPAVFFPAGDSSSALSSSDSASDASESDSESVSLLDFFDCFEVFFCWFCCLVLFGFGVSDDSAPAAASSRFLFGAAFLLEGAAAAGFFADGNDDFLLAGLDFGFDFDVELFFAGPPLDAAAVVAVIAGVRFGDFGASSRWSASSSLYIAAVSL